jgi:hypothetical protein
MNDDSYRRKRSFSDADMSSPSSMMRSPSSLTVDNVRRMTLHPELDVPHNARRKLFRKPAARKHNTNLNKNNPNADVVDEHVALKDEPRPPKATWDELFFDLIFVAVSWLALDLLKISHHLFVFYQQK